MGELISIIVGVLGALGILWGVLMWCARVNADRSQFREFMTDMKQDVRDLRTDIKSILSSLSSVPVESASPLRLTDRGREFAEFLDAGAWAEPCAASVVDHVQGKEPYEIDQFVVKYLDDRLTLEMQKQVEKCAYEFGVECDSVLSVLRVVLRDALLAKTGQQTVAVPSP